MSGHEFDLDQLLYDAEQGWALSTEARVALAAEVRALRAALNFKQGIIDDLAATVERLEAEREVAA